MANPDSVKAVLTVQDLANRWSCSRDTALGVVLDPTRPVPYFTLGNPTGQKKRRQMKRFRLTAVERWEADQERVARAPETVESPGRPAFYDGPDYMNRPRRRRGECASGRRK